MFKPGPTELIIILVIVLILFGHNRIPQIFSGLGKGIRNFRKEMGRESDEAKKIDSSSEEESSNSET